MIIFGSGEQEDDGTLTPDQTTIGSPGGDVTPVPSSDPWGSVTGVFGQVGSILDSGISGYLKAQQASADLNYKRTQQDLNNQIALAKLRGANAIDSYRIAAETQTAQRYFGRMPGLTALFGGTTPPSSGDMLMLAMTAAGLYFAWQSVHKA
jgi:hypothetical protein